MLLETVVEFSNKEYKNSDIHHICKNCNHPNECSGSCEVCLDEVHFPNNYINGKLEYDCINMLNYYVCKYSHKYCSEIEYALEQSEILKNLKEFNVMSIGCGASPDLMALEFYRQKHKIDVPIIYRGFDKNIMWKDIHKEISNYGKNNNFKVGYEYVDVVEYFNKYYIKGINVIILQYVISYFYNTDQILTIDKFFDDLIDVIEKKNEREKLLIIINDVNSCYRGRDYFLNLYKKIKKHNFHGYLMKKYFNYNIKNSYQRYGEPYESCDNLHIIKDEIRGTYNSAINCSSAQLIIEIN